MRKNLVLSTILVAAFMVAFAVIVALNRPDSPTEATEATGASAMSSDSHVVLEADSADAPVMVEFIDFECEACAAVHPLVKQIKQDYEGELTIAVRYFPLDGHPNSVNAALAVEAAAQQDQFEAMADRMFETQTQWSHQEVPQDAVFRGFAQDLGLDLDAYDATIAADATLERVQKDYDAAVALGAQSTPTFFLDDTMLELTSEDDLRGALDDAIAN